jgi:hypothetical protein
MAFALITARTKAEMTATYLSAMPQTRSRLAANFREQILRLANYMREVTDRTMARSFENQSLGISHLDALATGEIERVCSGQLDELEKLDQTRGPILYT